MATISHQQASKSNQSNAAAQTSQKAGATVEGGAVDHGNMPNFVQRLHKPTPSQLLSLQRMMGNQAVQRLLSPSISAMGQKAGTVGVQAKSSDASGPDGGQLDDSLADSIRRASGGGHTLGGPILNRMEQGFGANFSDVQIHTDARADQLNRSLNARAFTTGKNIFFKRGEYNPSSQGGQKLLAHELTHVVQQGGGKNAAIQTKLTVGPANDRYEAEADRVAEQVMRAPTKPQAVGKQAMLQRKPNHHIQRVWANPFSRSSKKKEAEKAEPDELLLYSSQFEERLGRYIYNNPAAQAVAATLTNKMLNVLMPEFDETNREHQEEVSRAFGDSKKGSAGNVGTEFADVYAVLRSGNLRERMTAIYNAMFGSFKTLMNSILTESNWGEAERRGLDTRKLKIRQRQLRLNPMAKDPYRKPRAFLDRKKVGMFDGKLLSGGETRQDVEGSKVTKRTAGQLEEGKFKAGLSERERKFMFPEKGMGEDIGGDTLTWEEGGTALQVRDKNKWVKHAKTVLKLPVVAGPSGTAQRFFQIYEWLGKPVKAEDLRLALLGWMLTENDHSFHEIMMMSAEYGLPYAPGQAAYRQIAPLTEAEIRKNVNTDPAYPGLFPDEIVYHKKIDTGKSKLLKPYDQSLRERTNHAKLIEDQFKMDKDQYEESGLQQLLRPVTAYTTIAYQTINMVAGGNPTLTKLRLRSFLSDVHKKYAMVVDSYRKVYIRKEADNALDRELMKMYNKLNYTMQNMIAVVAYSPDITAEEIIAEAKEHRPHVNSGLELLPTFTGKVYRGEAKTTMGRHAYKQGDKFRIGKFLSASRQTVHATSYANSSAGIKPGGAKQWYAGMRTPYVLEINSRTGRDVNSVTVNEHEGVRNGVIEGNLAEVVFLPGTEFVVSEGPQRDPLFENIHKVVLTETKGGGVTDFTQRVDNSKDASPAPLPVDAPSPETVAPAAKEATPEVAKPKKSPKSPMPKGKEMPLHHLVNGERIGEGEFDGFVGEEAKIAPPVLAPPFVHEVAKPMRGGELIGEEPVVNEPIRDVDKFEEIEL